MGRKKKIREIEPFESTVKLNLAGKARQRMIEQGVRAESINESRLFAASLDSILAGSDEEDAISDTIANYEDLKYVSTY